MIVKKVCMLGAFSVGKTSLVERFVTSIFSDSYLSTVGVSIKKKTLVLDGADVGLVLWDMEGKDDYGEVNLSYLRGAMGFFLVVDGKRRETLDVAEQLRAVATGLIGNIPHMVLINKSDCRDEWEVTEEDLLRLEQQGIPVLQTSAKSGDGVEDAFAALARNMLGGGV